MTTKYAELNPALYEIAARLRAQRIGALCDLHGDKRPMLAQALMEYVYSVLRNINIALDNDAQGTNVVPHLLRTLDELADELEGITPRY